MTLNEVLKNTNYDVALFSEEARKYIEDAIVVKTVRGKEMAHITCLKRGKEIVLKPEEAVRQLYLYKLIHEYGYPVSRIEVEFPIHFGREVKRADIAIIHRAQLSAKVVNIFKQIFVNRLQSREFARRERIEYAVFKQFYRLFLAEAFFFTGKVGGACQPQFIFQCHRASPD